MQVLIRPAAPVTVSGTSPGGMFDKNGRYDWYGIPLRRVLSEVYDIPETRVDAPEWCSQAKYDLSVIVPQHGESLRLTLLRQTLEAAFRMRVHKDAKETSVYILRKIEGQQPRLPAAKMEGETGHWSPQKGELAAMGRSIERVTWIADYLLHHEVLDETGLTGRYDFNLKWDPNQPTSVIAAIREQLGLELVEGHRRLEHLVVDSIEEAKTW